MSNLLYQSKRSDPRISRGYLSPEYRIRRLHPRPEYDQLLPLYFCQDEHQVAMLRKLFHTSLFHFQGPVNIL